MTSSLHIGITSGSSTWTLAAGKWGRPYLTRKFFTQIHDTMRQHVLLIMAKGDGRSYIAGALNFIGGDTLYGRHWGCTVNVPFLHFETCYYQAIDFAMANASCGWLKRAHRANISWRAVTCR